MSIGEVFHGSLFAGDLLAESIVRSADWAALDDGALDDLEASFRSVFVRFPTASAPNESQTEDDLIWPVLRCLGWTASLRQQNLTAHGREDVPDGLLFADDAAKDRANEFTEEWRRYALGVAVVESKRWLRPLDRRVGSHGEGIAPSTQMLRYLRRVDDLTSGELRWGILTNGARWRLYHQGARSVSEQFFEIDLAALLDLPGHNDNLFALSESERRHGLKLFVLFFRREAFLPGEVDSRTLHQRALDEGRFHQERVAANLSDMVFGRVFPDLARAIAAAAPDAPLGEVRDAALVVLYRLLFILYAEDRDLLPVRDGRYDDYGLRDKVRGDVGRRKDRGDIFSEAAARYWSAIDDLCRAIDVGDPSIGLPPYNGGLFDRERVPLLDRVRLGDRVMADVIDTLSFDEGPDGRRYINYRDLSVQQLGSIYERLLEHEIVRDAGEIIVRPNVFARKGSGSYYTPDDLVGLILEETIGPLVRSRLDAFTAEAVRLRKSRRSVRFKLDELKRLDPATKLLDLKICDPAMGSGHFLVGLVDYLADRVIASMAEAEAAMEGYVSSLVEGIDTVRDTVLGNAEERGWTIRLDQLDDRHVVRRMVLKRCVYGVDKNPMAVELAKVSLWLHTFTVGAPLGFLDHHLRCGDSLFGAWVRQGFDRAEEGGALFLHEPLGRAMQATRSMQVIEMLSDAEIGEAERSAGVFARIQTLTAPLDAFLSLVHAFEWLNVRNEEDEAALQSFFLGAFGDPVDVAAGAAPGIGEASPLVRGEAVEPKMGEAVRLETDEAIGRMIGGAGGPKTGEAAGPRIGKPAPVRGEAAGPEMNGAAARIADGPAESSRFALHLECARTLVLRARKLVAEERFLNWQVAFPGVWSDWGSSGLHGGFDAVVGNPPWDRMKLQQVEWFAARRPEIAHARRAADRKRMIGALRDGGDPLAADFERANERADSALRAARTSGDYPWLARGDVNLYSLFVERAMALVGPRGVVGLLTPSGIASDKTAAPFFRSVATEGRLRALYDFENRRTRYDLPPYFPDVDSRFKFCAFVAGRSPAAEPAHCAFFLQAVGELQDPERRFPLTAEDFAAVNPNTGTAPIFRTRRDAELTTAIYRRLPVLVDRSTGKEVKTWPVKYATMFHMTNDSGRFRTREELEEREGAWPVGGNRFDSATGEWVPLYEGKMVQAFDHRAASIVIKPENLHRPAQPLPATLERHRDPSWLPDPQFWVAASVCGWPPEYGWVLGFKEITAPTNARTFIAALLPAVGFGNKVPILWPETADRRDGYAGELDEPSFPGGVHPRAPASRPQRAGSTRTTVTDLHHSGAGSNAPDVSAPRTPVAGVRPDRSEWLLAANLNATIFDFVTRQKIQGQTLNLFIVEQLPVVPLEHYEAIRFGPKTAAEIVREAVLELTYTAHDMAPFARDLGYVDETGAVRPPFRWDEERRLRLRAKLDAVFFHLYGVTDRDDVRYVYSTFPIVERQETEIHGRYRSRDLCLAYLNALAAGRTDAEPDS